MLSLLWQIWNWLWSSFNTLFDLVVCSIKRAVCDWLFWFIAILFSYVATWVPNLPDFEGYFPNLSDFAGWIKLIDYFFPLDLYVNLESAYWSFALPFLAINIFLRIARVF